MSGRDPDQAAASASAWPGVLAALFAAGCGALLLGLAGRLLFGTAGVSLALIGLLGGFAWSLIRTMQQMLAAERARLSRPKASEPPAPQQPAEATADRAPPPTAAAADVAPSDAGTSAPHRHRADAPRRSAPAEPSALQRQFERAWTLGLAWFRRGNPIARAGILILFFGAAFLAKYAAEHSLFPLELRLALVATVAIVLLAIGWRLRDSQRAYALTLQGGGVAVLYLTIYSSLRLYQLIPPAAALALLCMVALAGAGLAVAQRALPLAVIGFAGGFAAPLLASSGSGSHVALFSYYAALNLGVFTVAWFRAWRALNLVGFVFTFGVTALWRGTRYNTAELWSTDAFLLLFFLLYVAVSVLFALRQPTRLKNAVSGTLVFGLPVVVFGLHASLVSEFEKALAWSALGFGIFYLGLAWLLWRSGRDSLRLLCEAFAALGVIFASLAVPLGFDRDATALIWAVEGAGFVWLGLRQDRLGTRAFGALLQFGAALNYLQALDGAPPALALINSWCLGALGLAAAGYLSGLWLQRAHPRHRLEAQAQWLFLLWALLWWLVAGIGDIARFAPHSLEHGLILSLLAATALLLWHLGRRLSWPASRQLSRRFMPLVLALASLALALSGHPLDHGAWFGWPLLWISHYLLLRQAGDGKLDGWLHPLGLWTLALIALPEAHWQLDQRLDGVWPALTTGLLPALLLWITVRGPARWPLRDFRPVYRFRGGLPLALVTLFWLLLMNLGSNGDPAPLPYVPLLNPLDLSVMITVLALTGWWLGLASTERQVLRSPNPHLLPALIAGLAFLWLNAALLRGLHWTLGTPLDGGGILRSVLVQAALSIFWSLLGFAAMLAGTRRAMRWLWLGGAGLMGVVVLKLFLIDLAGSGTLARIVSFLGVGALLLVAGYLSPLPPRRPGAESGP